mmetsp:Transcript_16580/g.14076  ORF Transcript_16580/g.14076 Transcript_16580/m.14076 type:complete len:104 (+) Transcript_16580:499-810(+)
MGLPAVELLYGLRNSRHTSHTTDKNDLTELILLQASVPQAGLARSLSLVEQVSSKTLELGTSHSHLQMLGTRGIGGDEGQVDLSLNLAGKLNLGGLSGLLQPL